MATLAPLTINELLDLLAHVIAGAAGGPRMAGRP
jgi:hypothetical protein